MKLSLQYQNRAGLLPEHDGVAPVVYDRVRLTIPAREALIAAGARIVPHPADGGATLYRIELGARVPEGLVAANLIGESVVAVRRHDEPPYPGEHPSLWDQVDFSPCPQCGAPLVWYEAGYVPGYRVCASPPHHHVLARTL